MDDLWGNAWNDSSKEISKTAVNGLREQVEESQPEVGFGMPVWHATEAETSWQPEIQTESTPWDGGSSPWDRQAETARSKEDLCTVSPTETTGEEQASSLPASSTKVELRTPSPEPDEPTTEFVHQEIEVEEGLHPPFLPPSPSSPIPTNPDAFGSFETAQEDLAAGSWASPGISNAISNDIPEDPGWGSAWQKETEPETEPQKDVWATAQEEQIKRNKRVPPAVVEAIMDKWRELEAEVWPSEQTDPSSWKEKRIEDIEKISKLIESFLPPLSLAPLDFSTTAIQKNLHTALKLTKSYKIVLSSPLAHMRPSSGSDAWETHVKTYQEIDPAQLDQWAVNAAKPIVIPVEDRPKVVAQEKKATSGWGFWNRKQPSISQPRPVSASGPRSSPAASARPSIDVSSSQKPSIDLPTSANPAKPAIAAKPIVPATSSHPPLFEPPRPVTDEFEEPKVQPSAVSRFFGKLSRNKEGNAKANNRHSTFLSSNDLDFLSDVPSFNDNESGEDNLISLEKMLASPASKESSMPLPLLVSPPKLAPPPRISPSVEVTQDVSLETKPTKDDDFMDFLGAPSGIILPSLSPNKPPQTNSSTFRHTLPSPLPSFSESPTSDRSPSSQVFTSKQPPNISHPSHLPSSQVSSVAPLKAVQNDLSSLMDFGMGPKVISPPLPPSKSLGSPSSGGLRNDVEDDFDGFVSSSAADDSFNSFPNSSFAGSSSSHNEVRYSDASFDRDISNFLNGGSSNSQTISAPRKQAGEFDDFAEFFGPSSPPPPQPPSKPSTPVRQTAHVRPSVAKLGATKVTMSSALSRSATSSPAPLIPPPPGSSVRRETTNMMDDPIFSLASNPPLPMNRSRPSSTDPGKAALTSTSPPLIIPGPGLSKSSPPMKSVFPPVSQPSSSRPSPTISTLGKSSSDVLATSSPPPIIPGPRVSNSPPHLMPAATPKAAPSGVKGLSAQDLSFFEGL